MKRLALLITVCCGVLSAPAVHAQAKYPTKPVRLVIPFSPGAASDFLGRTVGVKLSERYGQQVVSDNRPGGGGVLGSSVVANAQPDGYTLIVVAPPHLVNALIHQDPQYKPIEDFTPISQVASLPNLLVVPAGFQAKNIKELIALAKARPGELNIGSAGVGSLSHLSGEFFKQAAQINVVHIPFKLFSDALTEMFAGRVHMYTSPITAVMPMVRDGKLRPMAVTAANRINSLPDVPTMAESGLPGATMDTWFGIAGPKGMPKRLVDQINEDIAAVLKDQDTRDRFARQGADAVSSTPAQLLETMKTDFARYRKLVAAAGIKAN